MTQSEPEPTAASTEEGGEGIVERVGGLVSGSGREKPIGSRISAGSVFYTRVLPILILAMGILTAALILLAAGVLLGIIPFR